MAGAEESYSVLCLLQEVRDVFVFCYVNFQHMFAKVLIISLECQEPRTSVPSQAAPAQNSHAYFVSCVICFSYSEAALF